MSQRSWEGGDIGKSQEEEGRGGRFIHRLGGGGGEVGGGDGEVGEQKEKTKMRC